MRERIWKERWQLCFLKGKKRMAPERERGCDPSKGKKRMAPERFGSCRGGKSNSERENGFTSFLISFKPNFSIQSLSCHIILLTWTQTCHIGCLHLPNRHLTNGGNQILTAETYLHNGGKVRDYYELKFKSGTKWPIHSSTT